MWYSIIAINIIWLNVIRITVPGDSSLLGWDAVTLGEWFPLFWRNILHSFSRIKWTKNNCHNRLRMTQNRRLWVCTACTASMARSASDQLAAHWDKNEETSPTHLAWSFQQVGCGSTQIQPLPSILTQGHQILHQAWLHLPTFQVSNGDGTVSQQLAQGEL